ncbi:MAG: bifunctional oligoribonuclease/PAP phosphatase NrnA [Erysipelotrichaceae bacterium]|jgi:phosphoesterase RecJ-like protein|nr:bifunctional oligoribonuclease/PAP phosphatase NrnA [Erysipelotrichaceae bacterium]
MNQNNYQKVSKQLLKLIKQYDKIVVFRHAIPDFDALGSQMGLVSWLKDNFKAKEIHFVGDNHVTFTGRLYPKMEELKDSWFEQNTFLAIVIDVGSLERVSDPRFTKADKIVKIDHHPHEPGFGDLDLVDTSFAAAAEFVVTLLANMGRKYQFSKAAASYFYSALVGDTGGFRFSSTTKRTFEVAALLLSSNINISEIYQLMFEKELKDLAVQKFILDSYQLTKHGVAYYILKEDDLTRIGITSELGKVYVNMFSNIKEIEVWCSITEDKKDNCYRVSIRSKRYPISEVAKKFKGGGHKQASGATLLSLEELNSFLKALDDEIIKNSNL